MSKKIYYVSIMKELNGISASPGIVIGRVLLFLDDNFNLPEYTIAETDIKKEVDRLSVAVAKSRRELEDLRSTFQASGKGIDENQFVDVHIMMLEDPEFLSQIHVCLESDLKNVEMALLRTSRKMISLLEQSGDEYLKERALDIYDVSKRILNNLISWKRVSLADLTEEVIVVGKNLLPSDTLAMNKRMVRGIAMEMGGRTSHTAILARSFEIPAVLGLSEISSLVKNGEIIIVDGYRGTVILNPDEATLFRYQSSIKEWQKRDVQLFSLNELPAETLDGKFIALEGNIEVVDEVDSVLAYGADGIGLFRSEFLLMQHGMVDDEEAQYAGYRKVVEGMKGTPVTIRTLDIGGDKTIPFIKDIYEENPILGWRSVRFCLSSPDLFKRQLRAILRASVHGSLRVMFPMISGVSELKEVLALLEESKEELRLLNIPFREDILVGIMIEIPAAAMISDALAKMVDFFSIGTNDLIQYSLAVDRGNERVAYLYSSFHLGVLRLIKMIIDNAHNNNIPVSMCGEMAGDPLATVVLLGLGLDTYSLTSFGIPEIKQIIRSVSVAEAEAFVATIMELCEVKEIEKYIRKWMNERFEFLSV